MLLFYVYVCGVFIFQQEAEKSDLKLKKIKQTFGWWAPF
jgi:hypothetical protein